MKTLRPTNRPGQPLSPNTELVLEGLHAIRLELVALRTLVSDIAGAYLNARFPCGKPTDRWPRHGRGAA